MPTYTLPDLPYDYGALQPADADAGAALADLVFGLTSLSQVLLQHLADAGGTTPELVLERLATVYSRQPD